MRNLIAIAVLLFGCQTYDGLYIDDSCSDREIELIETAVEKLNTAVGEEVVYINGVVNGGEDDIGSLEDRDIVFCDEDPKVGGNALLGMEHVQDIFLRRNPDDEKVLSNIMHELGHYIGAHHITDIYSVMHRTNSKITEYTDNDKSEIMRSI